MDSPERKSRVKDSVTEHWQIFSWLGFSLREGENSWLCNCEAFKDCWLDFRNLLVDGNIWRTSESISLFGTVHIAQNCSKGGNSLYVTNLILLLCLVTALRRLFESAAGKTFIIVAIRELFVNRLTIASQRHIFHHVVKNVMPKRYEQY